MSRVREDLALLELVEGCAFPGTMVDTRGPPVATGGGDGKVRACRLVARAMVGVVRENVKAKLAKMGGRKVGGQGVVREELKEEDIGMKGN